MELQPLGIAGILILGGLGWILILYWMLRLMRFAEARWPGRTHRVILVTMLGFVPLSLGGWLILTLLWPVIWIGTKRAG